MSRVGQLANFLDGIPVVANSAQRDALFPSPDTNQRVHNLATHYIERWDGANWQEEIRTDGKGVFQGTPWFDITHPTYGADPTGINDATAAIKAALAVAVSTNGVVFVPRGTYLITPASTANAITVPANVSLIGEGYESVLKWNVSVITADGFYSTLLYNSNSRIANLQMDGQKSALVRSGRTSVQCVGISGATTNLSGFVLEDLWVHDIPAVNAESFGVMTAGGASDFQWRRIKSYNIEGTGIHVAGDGAMQASNLPLTPATNADVDECVSHDNTWQGISVFGASNIRVRDFHAYNNNDATIKGAGINVEWSQEIDFYACVAHDNFVGAQVQGRSNNVRFWNPHLYNNNSALDAAYGEIRIVATTYTITPFPKGMPNNTEIHGGAIVPRTGSNHLYYKSDSAVTSSTGSHSIPDSIVLDHPDAASWTITTDGGSTHYTGLTLKVVRRQIGLPAPLEWYNPSSITISAYGGTGNVNANAATFAINAQFANAQAGWSLKANRRYLIHVRGKPHDANTWAIRAVDSGGTVREVLTFPSQTVDLNAWFAGDVVFVPTADCFLQLMLLTAPGGTSTFDLDYLRVFALADGDSQAADEPSDLTGVLTDGGSVFVPVGTAGFYSVALGGSRTIKNANGGWNSKTIVLELQNNTGGAVTTTFESNYKLAGAWTDPATTKKRKIAFRRVSSTVWEEMWRSAGDL